MKYTYLIPTLHLNNQNGNFLMYIGTNGYIANENKRKKVNCWRPQDRRFLNLDFLFLCNRIFYVIELCSTLFYVYQFIFRPYGMRYGQWRRMRFGNFSNGI
jgi:hypothetical protein